MFLNEESDGSVAPKKLENRSDTLETPWTKKLENRSDTLEKSLKIGLTPWTWRHPGRKSLKIGLTPWTPWIGLTPWNRSDTLDPGDTLDEDSSRRWTLHDRRALGASEWASR